MSVVKEVNDILEEVKNDLNKFFGIDYHKIMHSLRVYNKVRIYHHINFVLNILALLHDVVEDTNYTISDLENMYKNKFVAIWGEKDITKMFESLDAITRREDETYFDYINRCKLNRDATIIKILDLEENLFRCYESNNKSLAQRYIKALDILIAK